MPRSAGERRTWKPHTVNVATTYRPLEERAQHGKDVATVGDLIRGHAIKNRDDIAAGNLGERLVLQDRLCVETKRPNNQRRPTLASARFREMVCIIREGEVDRLPAPLLIRLNRIDPLGDEAQQPASFLPSGRGGPWRAMSADR